MEFKYFLCLRNSLCIALLSVCALTACNTPVTRPQPKFEIVEDLNVRTEGLLDLGLEVRAKIHNYGATGSQKIKFKGYTGYFMRKSSQGNVPSWNEEFTHVETVFLEAGQTKTVRHIFKQIDILDTGLRGGVELLR